MGEAYWIVWGEPFPSLLLPIVDRCFMNSSYSL